MDESSVAMTKVFTLCWADSSRYGPRNCWYEANHAAGSAGLILPRQACGSCAISDFSSSSGRRVTRRPLAAASSSRMARWAVLGVIGPASTLLAVMPLLTKGKETETAFMSRPTM